MAAKRSKHKPRARSNARSRNIKLADLQVPKGGAVKGGDTKTTTTTTTKGAFDLVVAKQTTNY